MNINGTPGNDIISGTLGVDVIDGLDGDDIINGSSGDTVYGGQGYDVIYGSYLDGGAGEDTMYGVDDGNGATFIIDEFWDEVHGSKVLSAGKYNTAYINIKYDPASQHTGSLPGFYGPNNLWSGVYNGVVENISVFYIGPETSGMKIMMGAGTRRVEGSELSDKLSVSGGVGPGVLINGNAGDDEISSGGFGDTLFGGVGNDTLSAGGGDDILAGGAGVDVLYGGNGNDFYIVADGDASDVIEDFSSSATNANGGVDQVSASISVDISKYKGIENIELTGSSSINASGDAGNNQILGNTGANVLVGAAGNDTLTAVGGNDLLQGGSGNDSLVASQGADTLAGGADDDVYVINGDQNTVQELAGQGKDIEYFALNFSLNSKFVLAANVEVGIISSQAAFNLDGNDLANTLQGNDAANNLSGLIGDDSILGAAGADVLSGGDGNDSLLGGTGQDTLTGDLGNDVLFGEAGADALSGGSGSDTLIGGADADTLRGGLGADSLSGEQGSDLYVLAKGDGADVISDNDSSTGDVDVVAWVDVASTELVSVIEDLAGGLLITNSVGDVLTVRNQFSAGGLGQIEQFKFSDGVTWSASDIQSKVTLVGTEGNDAIYAPNDIANRVSGFGGADAIYGGTLNDTISGGTGNDSINGLAGNDSLNGDDGNDILVGDLGSDALDGGAGDDTLQGGAGNDRYVIDSAADTVVEKIGEGRDTVRGSVSFTAANNVEVAILLGSADLTLRGQAAVGTMLIGNTGNNLILGGSGGDVLSGAAGRDTLVGGDGTDIYQLTDEGDVIIEQANGTGIDAIVSVLANTTMAENVEYLAMTGFCETATGSSGDNVILGNDNSVWIDGKAGDDQVFGGTGLDTLFGGLGDDTLTGYGGSDLYRIDRGDGFDTIVDTDATAGNQDSLVFGAVSSNQLWLSKVGNDLAIQVIGTTDGTLISNWYSGSANQIEVISAGGQNLTNDRVQGLVQAMSGLTPPAQGQLNLSASQQTALSTALTQAWR